jgi:AcrR family transcriptional regulator
MTQAKRTYHHGDLRQHLLSTARQLLEERGSAALTLREVARRVGVAAPSAYHHFASFDALAATLAKPTSPGLTPTPNFTV